MEDVATLFSWPRQVIYNWTKRSDPKRKPRRIIVGKSIRFPKKWLASEKSAVGESAVKLTRSNYYWRKDRDGSIVWMVRWWDDETQKWMAVKAGKTENEAKIVEAS